jgi:zinc D-Ala-D-Ala carboxypeptidase
MRKTENGWASSHFSTRELACSCCGENKIQYEALKQLELLRIKLGRPVILNSAYRCSNHPEERHKSTIGTHVQGIAFDIRCHPREVAKLVSIAYDLGFRGFGYAKSFLHIDMREYDGGWFYS